MKLLLTSAGISNATLRNSLIGLLGKPISEANALFIPTAIYPFPGGPGMAWQALCGNSRSPLCQLGWKSLGLLELTALPSIDRHIWHSMVGAADALLVWGGDPVYLAHWLRESGLAELLPSLQRPPVYVGVSAGSMAVASVFAETYRSPPNGCIPTLESYPLRFATPQGEIDRTFVMAKGAGLVDFALIPHFGHEDHPDASPANAQVWAKRVPVPVYGIDDQTAVRVYDGRVEVISEGRWQLFTPRQ